VISVNIGEEADPVEVPLPVHPDDQPAEPRPAGPEREPVVQPDAAPVPA
jgi:hypothetical protein